MDNVINMAEFKEEHPARAFAERLGEDPNLAAAVARHPVSSILTQAPKISGGPGPVKNPRRIR